MSFEEPISKGFTIYSKSGCPNCRNVKNLLTKKNIFFHVIDCDDYLLFERDEFLSYIEKKACKEYKSLPIVFKDDIFIGGFVDTEKYLQQEQEQEQR